MAKYKWYKKRRGNTYSQQAQNIISRINNRPIYETSTVTEPAWRQEILGEWVGDVARPRNNRGDEVVAGARERLNEQQLRSALELELRNNFDDFIGQPNNTVTIDEVANRARETLNSFRHRGLITDHRVERDENNVSITLRPNQSIADINLTIQLDS
jgi:hypothetical protein